MRRRTLLLLLTPSLLLPALGLAQRGWWPERCSGERPYSWQMYSDVCER